VKASSRFLSGRDAAAARVVVAIITVALSVEVRVVVTVEELGVSVVVAVTTGCVYPI